MQMANSLILAGDLIKRDFRTRYLGSILGRYWNFIHPVMMILIYSVIFSQLMHARIGKDTGGWSFTLYLCAGMFPWTFFVEAVSRTTGVFFEHAALVKKLPVAREVLYVVSVGSSFATFVINYSLFAVFALVAGSGFDWSVLQVVPLSLLLFGFALGFGSILGLLNVFLRDVAQGVSILFQVWFWLTPIVYVVEMVPSRFQFLLKLNPMFYFISAYQDIMFHRIFVSFSTWIACFLVCLTSLGVSLLINRVLISEVADEL